MMLKPALRPPLRAPMRGANAPREGVGGVLNALSPSKAKLASESGDVNWVVAGDSTTNATTEWVYLLFAALAALYPAVTFVYYGSDGFGGYAAPVTVSSGTGARTFRLYNNSVASQRATYLMGSLFTGAFVTPGRSWDLVVWNHGKNHVVGSAQAQTEGEFLGAIAQVQLSFASANHLVVDQYKNRDDTAMDLAHTCWLDVVANEPKISKLDQYGGVSLAFADFTDNNHATDAANSAILLPHALAYWNATAAGTWTAATPWLQQTATDLLKGASGEDYGNFGLNGDGTNPGAANVTPGGFVNSGTITYAQEGTIKYGAAARSQKMSGSGAAQTRMQRTISADKLALAKGNNVVLTVIEYVEAGAAATCGRTGLQTTGTGGVAVNSRSENLAQGGWRVRCIGPMAIPTTITAVLLQRYHDSAASPDTTHAVYTQTACLTVGSLPRLAA